MDSFRSLLLFFSLLFAVAVSESVLKILPEKQRSGHLLLTSDGNIRKEDELFCESWRYAVETNDAGFWEEIPRRCVRFVDEYMNGRRYASDSDVVAGYSLQRAQGVEIASDGKDVWIFDIDETLLSNLPYYAAHGYGYVCRYFSQLEYQMRCSRGMLWAHPFQIPTNGGSGKFLRSENRLEPPDVCEESTPSIRFFRSF